MERVHPSFWLLGRGPIAAHPASVSRRMRSSGILLGWVFASTALADEPRILNVPIGDTRVRRVDPGADGLIDLVNHHLPDVALYRIGRWKPDDAQLDLFTGQWNDTAEFLRF